MNNNWLEDLKIGDIVFVKSRSGLGRYLVLKITKTQIQVGNATGAEPTKIMGKFNIRTGNEIGTNGYDWSYLEQFTDELNTKYLIESNKRWVTKLIKELVLPDDIRKLKELAKALKTCGSEA